MEVSHQLLSTDSWLVNMKASNMEEYASDDDNEEAAFIDMDPSLSPSKRFSNVNPHDFINLNFPISDHQLMISSCSLTKKQVDNSSRRRSVLGIFHKLVDFLKPLCQKIRCGGCTSGSSSTVVISTRSGEEIMKKNWESSEGTSLSLSLTPRTSIANYSDDDWRRSCDSESSIYEAVLHCKRTIANGE